MNKKVRKSFLFDKELDERLRHFATETDWEQTDIVQKALRMYLDASERKGRLTIILSKPEVSPKGKSKSPEAIAA